MIQNNEKMLIHIYAQAAGVRGPHYRQLLKATTNKDSSADPAFSHADCDRILASLETILFDRVHRGEISDPRTNGHKWIKDEFHFRTRCRGPGLINSRQAHIIDQLWTELQPWLQTEQRVPSYIAGIIRKATGRFDIGLTALSSSDAGHVIDALKDRLASAIKSSNEVPF